jgi:prepilin-type N-terminal cleavage/methylation domain-containing protein
MAHHVIVAPCAASIDRTVCRVRSPRRTAFTLVELLVVIGIIAVLISILLPSLNSARRAGNRVKCASALREIGNTMRLYANDSKGYFPPARLTLDSGVTYEISGVAFPDADGTLPYWTDFLAKYVTKGRLGSIDNSQAAARRRTVLWGCPSWEPYTSTVAGQDANRIQNGLGMNIFPTHQPDYPRGTSGPFGSSPAPEQPTYTESSVIEAWSPTDRAAKANEVGVYPNASNPPAGTYSGRWTKAEVYTKRGSERALIADSRFWALESRQLPTSGVIPPQPNIQNNATWTTGITGQTMFDLYRHGKTPGAGPVAGTFAARGGEISYNILYADNHVATATDAKEAYKSFRMKFPG